MSRSVDIIMTPLGGLINAKKEPFRFTDQHGSIAYFKDPMAAQYTKHVQGSGLPPAWGLFQQAIANAFRANVGSNDLGVGPTESKNIPVGTVNQIVAQGEVPVLDAKLVLDEEEGVFFGCVLDMIIGGAWDEKQWIRMMGPNGAYMMKKLQGAAIPQMDVFVTTEPHMKQVAKEELDALMAWANSPPPLRRVMARRLGIPPSLVQMYEQDLAQEQQDQLDAAMTGGGDMAAPGEGSPNGGPPGEAAGGPGGIPPAIAARMNGGMTEMGQ
jgi:hypothetical protein